MATVYTCDACGKSERAVTQAKVPALGWVIPIAPQGWWVAPPSNIVCSEPCLKAMGGHANEEPPRAAHLKAVPHGDA